MFKKIALFFLIIIITPVYLMAADESDIIDEPETFSDNRDKFIKKEKERIKNAELYNENRVDISNFDVKVDHCKDERPTFNEALALLKEEFCGDIPKVVLHILSSYAKDFDEGTSNRLLLHGVCGVGKTSLFIAIAEILKVPYIILKPSKIFSSYQGRSAQVIDELFELYKKYDRPFFICIDEANGFASRVDGLRNPDSVAALSTLLSNLTDHAKTKNMVIMATTNNKDALEEAFISRFEGKIYEVKNLTEYQRTIYLIKHLNEFIDDKIVLKRLSEEIAKRTEGFSGRDLNGVIKDSLSELLLLRRTNQDYKIKSVDFFEPQIKIFKDIKFGKNSSIMQWIEKNPDKVFYIAAGPAGQAIMNKMAYAICYVAKGAAGKISQVDSIDSLCRCFGYTEEKTHAEIIAELAKSNILC